MRSAPWTLRELLERLEHEGFITSEALSAFSAPFRPNLWSILLLVHPCSGWSQRLVAALLFLASLFGFHIFDSPMSTIIIGFIFILITLSVRRYTDRFIPEPISLCCEPCRSIFVN